MTTLSTLWGSTTARPPWAYMQSNSGGRCSKATSARVLIVYLACCILTEDVSLQSTKVEVMKEFRKRTVHEVADMICGNEGDPFIYRSSTYLSEFFADCDMEQYRHDGSARKRWVVSVLEEILQQPSESPNLPGTEFQTVVQILMDRADYTEADPERQAALTKLNATLAREGLEAYYAEDNCCYIRNTRTGQDRQPGPVVERALSKDEINRRRRLGSFMDTASEDDITGKVVLPLLQTLRFQKISVAGHKDKAMEFGNDLWMKYQLPTGHWLYFGLQIKKGKINATAGTKNENVATIHNQIMMMLGYEIFDPDINQERLVDHAIIVAGGEITKQAKNWLGRRLDASQRSQILFMDRADILHLFVVHNVPMPDEECSQVMSEDIL